MTRRVWLYGTGAALAVILTLLAGFWTQYDRVVIAQDRVDESRAARTDPYLALKRFLAGAGRPLLTLHDPALLDHLPENGVLVFLAPHLGRTLTPARMAQLDRWVKSGGHIVFMAAGNDDPLMRWAHTAYDRTTSMEGDHRAPVVRIPLPDGRELHALARSWWGLHSTAAAPDFSASDGQHTPIVFYRRGQGGITVLALPFRDLASNDAIGRSDNASVAWLLVSMVHAQGPILMASQLEVEGWWAWLWHNGRAGILAAAALILLALWYLVPRFGPVLPDPEPERRALTEHLAAMGRAVWRLDPERGLRYWLFCVRRNVLARAAIHDPAILSRSPAEQAQRVADRVATRAALKPRTVRVAVAGTATVEGTAVAREGFTRAVRILQRIEQQLRVEKP